MTEGPIIISDATGRSFFETGLVAMRDSHDRIFSKRSEWNDRDLFNNIAFTHEWIHYLQSITCAAVNFAAQEMLQLSDSIIKSAAQGEVADSLHRRFRELKESLYGCKANESVQILDRPGNTIIIPIPKHDQIGMLDIIEGVAVLESFKVSITNASLKDFLNFRDLYFPDSERSVYRWSFDWLANNIGLEASYELLAPVSFLALQAEDPSKAFVNFTSKLSYEEKLDIRELSDLEVLADLLSLKNWYSWLQRFEHDELESGHVLLDPCATYAVKQLGFKTVAQSGAVPSQVTMEIAKALFPPVIAYSGIDSVKFQIASYAKNGLLKESILDWTSIVGAAERLTIEATNDVDQFCPHRIECPHFESALCYKNFAPPGVIRSHEQCRFPNTLRRIAGLNPDELWMTVGRDRKSVSELVEAIEVVGETKLLAFVRKQRGSFIAWLGRDGYKKFEWKSQAVADKALKALKTGSREDVIEAKVFRDAVVNEVRRIANEGIGAENES